MSIIEPPVAPAPVRRATVDDAPALVRLRGLMLRAMGLDTGPQDAPWRRAAEQWYAEQLARPEEFAAFVVDDPELGVVSSAVGGLDRQLRFPPGPNRNDPRPELVVRT